jgi:Holliday junction resolvase RusA-like endonuclease
MISAKGRAYRERVVSILAGMQVEEMEGNLHMTLDLYPPDLRERDIDNTLKAFFDALQHGGQFKRDSQIKSLVLKMREVMRPDGLVVYTLTAA